MGRRKSSIGLSMGNIDLGEDGIKVRDSFGNQENASIGDLNASQDIQIKKPRKAKRKLVIDSKTMLDKEVKKF
jgi:hypothetical protein